MQELARRYVVMPLATDAPFDPADPDGAFVLKPWKDPAALRALRAYRDSCFPELRRDLDAWIQAIESGPTVRGDVGRRNEPFARPGKPKPPRSSATADARRAASPPGTTVKKTAKVPGRARKPAGTVTTARTGRVSGASKVTPRPTRAGAQRGTRAPAPRKPARKRTR
jgi:hypothetical protein